MEHKGPMFPPEYERLPKNVHFKYAGEKMVLSEGAEEVMGFYAAMLRTGLCKIFTFCQTVRNHDI